MTQSTQNVYTPEYLDSIRDRFPELAGSSEKELVAVLEQNDERKPTIYEYEVESALKEIDQEVSFEGEVDVYTSCPEQFRDKLNSALGYVINDLRGFGDIVLHISEKEPIGDREKAVGAPTSQSNFSFVADSEGKDCLASTENRKILFVISVKYTRKKDLLGRPIYILTPRLIEIPPRTASLDNDRCFKKEIETTEELVAEFKNIS